MVLDSNVYSITTPSDSSIPWWEGGESNDNHVCKVTVMVLDSNDYGVVIPLRLLHTLVQGGESDGYNVRE
jgi:hypothetical protein